mmetsp:Transcript_23607/g.55787  ORF Transcript_23607/g.55787 Transcript_23607/m.55787 type:complete len:97 (-) Transcript_23607:1815-2105(-)
MSRTVSGVHVRNIFNIRKEAKCANQPPKSKPRKKHCNRWEVQPIRQSDDLTFSPVGIEGTCRRRAAPIDCIKHYVQQDVRILRGHGIAVSNWCSGG